MSAKILIVDDHEIVRHGIRSLLDRTRPDWQVCGEGANGQEAIAAVKALAPDVVVMDITMPVMNGLQAAAEITKLKSPCRILVFTMHSSDRLIDEVRSAGAHGYLQKSHASRDLIAAIEKLLSGGTFFGPTDSTEANDGGRPRGPQPMSRIRAVGSKGHKRRRGFLKIRLSGTERGMAARDNGVSYS